MRKFLFILVTAICLYSPYAPKWGKFVVNAAVVLTIFSFCAKAVPKRRY